MRWIALLGAAATLVGCASIPDQTQLAGQISLASGQPFDEPLKLTVELLQNQQVIAQQTQYITFLPAFYSLRAPTNLKSAQLRAVLVDQNGTWRYRSDEQPISQPDLLVHQVISVESATIEKFQCQNYTVTFSKHTGQPTLLVNNKIELLTPDISNDQIVYQGNTYGFQPNGLASRLLVDGEWMDCLPI